MKIYSLCLVALVTWVHGASIGKFQHELHKREALDMVEYLERYGYITTHNNNNDAEDDGFILHSEAAIEYGLRKFQEFAGLPITGRLDKKTKRLMKKPRCGYKDIIDENDSDQPLSYTHLGRKWPSDDITWKTIKWTNKLDQADQRKAMKNAFQYWADVTPLTFTYTEGKPDIEIKFARGEHGDGRGNAFDGKGGTLAHAFGPGGQNISGDTHFDDDENWTYHSSRGTELETVAAHEFGHALGLGHSQVPSSLMAPFYQGYNPDFKLHEDDIRGIQLLYGSNPGHPGTTTTPKPTTTTTTTVTTTTAKTSKPDPNICSTKLDAIVTASDGFTYAFRDDQVFKLGSRGLEEGYPRLAKEIYPEVPSTPRGAFYMPDGHKTYIFKGSELWRYTNFELDENYPKNISTENFPEKLHAVITMKDSHERIRVFMFGSDLFWEWNPQTLQMMPGWSYSISKYWRGIPRGVEAAVTWYDGNMYFFKGKRFRKFDNYYRSVLPGYPMQWAPVWMRNICTSQEVKKVERQWDEESKIADIEGAAEMIANSASSAWSQPV